MWFQSNPAPLHFAVLLLSLPLRSTAGPVSPLYHHQQRQQSQTYSLTEAKLECIAPSSNTCAGASFPDECATASQALPNILDSFQTYKITSWGEQAAIVSLMAFESDDFKYNKNHFPAPGRPGQGARNMQSPTFNAKYAASIPALASKLPSASGDPASVLNLLLSDEAYDFGSGAWFLSTQCSQEVRSALQSGSETGWTAYITQCVSTTVTDARMEYWKRAVNALKPGGTAACSST
ncbi:hypothetical protein V8E54_003697 [Elaphomyces granulatus]